MTVSQSPPRHDDDDKDGSETNRSKPSDNQERINNETGVDPPGDEGRQAKGGGDTHEQQQQQPQVGGGDEKRDSIEREVAKTATKVEKDRTSSTSRLLDREKTCPFLLRVFCSTSRHNPMQDYAKGQSATLQAARDFPKVAHLTLFISLTGKTPANELQIYTWKDATLKELTSLVKEVRKRLVSCFSSRDSAYYRMPPVMTKVSLLVIAMSVVEPWSNRSRQPRGV